MNDIAIIGAGMAGCTLARRLLDAGMNVSVFDKGRAAGGRMATRVSASLRFDHGARFMTARGPALTGQLADWQRAGVIAPWTAAGSGSVVRWVGVPGMNALAPRLLWGAEVHLQTAITGMGVDEFGWWLASEDGRLPDCFDAVLVTVPAPQAVALFSRCAEPDLRSLTCELERIRYSPCWTLMLSFAERLVAADCLRLQSGSILGWAARDSGKPQRDASNECWVLHATPEWSQRHLGLVPEQVEHRLLEAFRSEVGPVPAPLHQRAHRWRHARVVEPLGRDCLWLAEHALGYASDGCLGEHLEDAFDSANALATRLLQGRARCP